MADSCGSARAASPAPSVPTDGFTDQTLIALAIAARVPDKAAEVRRTLERDGGPYRMAYTLPPTTVTRPGQPSLRNVFVGAVRDFAVALEQETGCRMRIEFGRGDVDDEAVMTVLLS